MLDDASYAEMWGIFDATGVRPEYLLPVLYTESGFRPEIKNNLGYEGLNQISQSWLAQHNINADDYLTWPASRQLREVVLPYMRGIIKWLGTPLRSGARVYEANFYPIALKHPDKTLNDVVVAAPSKAYEANQGFDIGKKGFISVRDLATYVRNAAAKSTVRTAIAKTYALRPDEVMRDPAFGEDFGGGNTVPDPTMPKAPMTPADTVKTGVIVGSIILAASLTVAYVITSGKSHRAMDNPLNRCPSSSRVQTLIFSRRRFTTTTARRWARNNGFRSAKVDMKPDTIRLRQEDPSHFRRMRTISLGDSGVRAVVGWPHC